MTDVDAHLDKLSLDELNTAHLTHPTVSKAAIRTHQGRFILSYVDKSANCVCSVCPKFYLQIIINEHFPNCIMSDRTTPHTYKNERRSVTDQLAVLKHLSDTLGIPFKPKHKPPRNKDGSPGTAAPPTLAHPQALIKEHKEPKGHRLLACCNNYPLAPLGRHLSSIFALFTPILEDVWYSTFVDLPSHERPIFPILTQSTSVVEMVKRLNQSIPKHLRGNSVHLEARDVAKMYTNIDLLGLNKALSSIIQEVFNHLSKNPKDPNNILKFILVSPTKGETKFTPDIPKTAGVKRNNTTGSLNDKSMFDFCLDETLIIKWTSLLINNIFICIGTDFVLKQVIGLPMGIQPAVFFANFYMFYYELAFARRLVAAKRFDIIAHFRFTARFVDDIISLMNKLLDSYLYLHQRTGNIPGIYPDCIEITLEQVSYLILNYLDITIYKHNGVWYTKIYDKRHHHPLNKIKHITYPHIESFISRSCKYNVVTAQLTRFFRICTFKADFLRVSLDFLTILARKHYSIDFLRRYTHKFVRKHSYLYGTRSSTSLVVNLFRDLSKIVPSAH